MATTFGKLKTTGAAYIAGVLTAAAGIAVTGALTAATGTFTGAVTATSFVNSALPGTSTGRILCVQGTGEIGYCNGDGTGSGTKTCSVCSDF